MRTPTPLPSQLHHQVFTRAEAAGLGVRDKRLKARDIRRIGHGIYRHIGLQQPEQAHLDDDAEARSLLLRALSQRTSNSWVSHTTAAQLYGLTLPERFTDSGPIHLTGLNRFRPGLMGPGVQGHRVDEIPADLNQIGGVHVSSPARLFCELAVQLSLVEHIIIGDQLVRQPHAGLEPRREPLTTPARLERAVRFHRGRSGAPQARDALAMVRVGSDSPPETLLRLALVRAGLPEPELQIPLDLDDPFAPVADAGYRWARVVIQYDGAHHFHPEQQASDQRRNAQFEHEGWTVVIANRVDLREHFTRTVGRVGRLLARAS